VRNSERQTDVDGCVAANDEAAPASPVVGTVVDRRAAGIAGTGVLAGRQRVRRLGRYAAEHVAIVVRRPRIDASYKQGNRRYQTPQPVNTSSFNLYRPGALLGAHPTV